MHSHYVTATLLTLAMSPLAAMDSHIVGPRALGMGGTGTAAADDQTASYWNPAVYGFFSRTREGDAKLASDPNFVGRKDWGVGLADVGAQAEIRGNLADWVQQLADGNLATLDNLGSGAGSPNDLKSIMAALDMINRFTPSRDTVNIAGNVGILNTRVLHVGLGFRQFAEGVVSVADLDKINIGFGTSTGAVLGDDILATATPDGYTPGHVPTLITGQQATDLATALGGSNPTEAVNRLDYAAGQAGLTQADVDSLLAGGSGLLYNAVAASSNPALAFDNNQTAAFTAGYTVAEVPLTVGWALNDHLSVGGNLKLMIGRVAGAKVRFLSDNNNLSDLLHDAFADAHQTVTAGVDLGFMARCSWAQGGLTVRNLNRPILKGGTYKDADGEDFTVSDVALEPQVAIGAAVYPWETVCLTADLDLTENQTRISTSSGRPLAAGIDPTLTIEYATRRLGVGAEWNAFRFLALRGGWSKDLAESETGMMIHGGLGLNFWAVRLDLAGAVSTERVEVDGSEVPRAFNVGAGLSVDF